MDLFFRGSMIIYDNIGTVLAVYPEGVSNCEFAPYETPVGIPFLILEYGAFDGKKLLSIDVTDPENPVPVFEPLRVEQTPEERIAELERLLAEKSGS